MPDFLPFPSSNALPASDQSPTEAATVIPLRVRPDSLTKDDVAALRALIPELTAGSRCTTGRDDAGEVWAIITGGNEGTFRAFLVTRDGRNLKLEDLRAPIGSHLVTYGSFAKLAAALGPEIGWRRADAG